jgi:DNA polymerase/3'-5' exonuclease PolX
LDLFFANELNRGLIYAIRTGSANFSNKTLGITWIKRGFKSIEGKFYKGNLEIPVREEKDLFHLLGLTYLESEKRY